MNKIERIEGFREHFDVIIKDQRGNEQVDWSYYEGDKVKIIFKNNTELPQGVRQGILWHIRNNGELQIDFKDDSINEEYKVDYDDIEYIDIVTSSGR